MKLMDKLFYLMPCHRIEERCLHFRSYHMPLCSRCFGIILGFIGISSSMFYGKDIAFSLSCIFIAIMFIDWSVQHFLKILSTNLRRILTGILAGIGLGSFFWDGILSLAGSFI